MKSPAQIIADVAFPRWALWARRVDDRNLLASILARKPSTVTWRTGIEPGYIEVENEDFPEIGRLVLTRSAARRLARFARAAVTRRDGQVSSICFTALSGLRRELENLPPGGVSHARICAGSDADDRNEALTPDLKIAISSVPPSRTGLAAMPDPSDPSMLLDRGTPVCTVAIAKELVRRGHLVETPSGGYRLAE